MLWEALGSFGEALGKLWEALGGFGKLWGAFGEALGMPAARRRTKLYTKMLGVRKLPINQLCWQNVSSSSSSSSSNSSSSSSSSTTTTITITTTTTTTTNIGPAELVYREFAYSQHFCI